MSNITLILHLPARDLYLSKYSTLDINRRCKEFYINLTNNEPDFAFNAVFDEILEGLGESKTFSITAAKEKGTAEFEDASVDYHHTGQGEILYFSKAIQRQKREQEEVIAEDEGLE